MLELNNKPEGRKGGGGGKGVQKSLQDSIKEGCVRERKGGGRLVGRGLA